MSDNWDALANQNCEPYVTDFKTDCAQVSNTVGFEPMSNRFQIAIENRFKPVIHDVHNFT